MSLIQKRGLKSLIDTGLTFKLMMSVAHTLKSSSPTKLDLCLTYA
jgi:hypothetical protein